jgi:hypothetical protein
MLQQNLLLNKPKFSIAIIAVTFFFSSCYSYRIATNAQAGTEITKKRVNAYFWGLLQSPKNGITTPNCDTLNANGMAEVQVKTNLGYAVITVVTLGIWCPIQVSWKCGKPCQKTQTL